MAWRGKKEGRKSCQEARSMWAEDDGSNECREGKPIKRRFRDAAYSSRQMAAVFKGF